MTVGVRDCHFLPYHILITFVGPANLLLEGGFNIICTFNNGYHQKKPAVGKDDYLSTKFPSARCGLVTGLAARGQQAPGKIRLADCGVAQEPPSKTTSLPVELQQNLGCAQWPFGFLSYPKVQSCVDVRRLAC
jgi:hypothetical protein